MQVNPTLMGGRERVGVEKTVFIALRYFGHQGNIRTISELFALADSVGFTCRDKVIRCFDASERAVP